MTEALVSLRFCRVMEGEESLPLFSPELLVLSPAFQEAVPHLPSISLFHGTADCSIHHEARYVINSAALSYSHVLVSWKDQMSLWVSSWSIWCKVHVYDHLPEGMMRPDGNFSAVLHLGMHCNQWVQRWQQFCMLERHTLTCSCRCVVLTAPILYSESNGSFCPCLCSMGLWH